MDNENATDKPLPNTTTAPTNVRWIVFALTCGTSWMLYLHRYTFALIKPELSDEYGWQANQLGYIDSVFSLCYSVVQFPSGVLADVTGAHMYLSAAILIWSVALGLHAWAPTYYGSATEEARDAALRSLRWARGLLGLGQAGCFAAVSRLTRTWFPLSVRTTVQGWAGVFSGRMGGMSANLIVATLLLGYLTLEWQTAVYILTAAGIGLSVAFALFFRNSPRNHPWVNQAEADLIEEIHSSPAGRQTENAKKRMSIAAMFRRMSPRSILNLIFLNVASTMSTVADNIYSNWIPLFLDKEHGLDFKEMGLYSALPLLGGACGGAFSGFLNDRLIRMTGNRRWTRSLIGCGGKGIAGVLLGTVLATNNPYIFCSMLFFVKFFADSSLAARWGTVTDIGGKATASVFAFNNSVAGIGAILAPAVYGEVIVKYGWTIVFMIACGAYALCSVSWLLVNCTIPLMREDVESPGG